MLLGYGYGMSEKTETKRVRDLRELREARAISQSYFGSNQPKVSSYETGRLNPGKIWVRRFAKAYRCSIRYVIAAAAETRRRAAQKSKAPAVTL